MITKEVLKNIYDDWCGAYDELYKVSVCIYNIDSHGEYKWIDKIKIEGAKLI